MPDLRFRLESALIRAALNLPVRVQRALVRKPIVIDGLELSPEIQLMLILKVSGTVWSLFIIISMCWMLIMAI